MKLTVDETYLLEQALVTDTYTPAKFNVRLAWQLQVLLRLLKVRDFADRDAMEHSTRQETLCTQLASLLESIGMWQYAVFALMHLTHSSTRKASIQDLIGRHVTISTEGSLLNEQEQFLVSVLHVPQAWILTAKATRAKYAGEIALQADYYILAKEWIAAHDTIVTSIAPNMIIQGHYKELSTLLGRLDAPQIGAWETGGKVTISLLGVMYCRCLWTTSPSSRKPQHSLSSSRTPRSPTTRWTRCCTTCADSCSCCPCPPRMRNSRFTWRMWR
jgi:nuclear pore complex protein Nup98-Nup96